MRLTVRGVVVLVAAPVLFMLGSLLGYPVFRALAGAALGAVLAGLIAAGRRPRVTVHREVYPDRVECGRSAMGELRVRNPRSRRHPSFTARDLLAGEYQDVTVRELAPMATATHRYALPTRRRGRYQVGPLELERTDPLGLVRNSLITGEVATLWVHPRRHRVRNLKVGWPRHHYDAPGTRDTLAGSTDLRHIREYVLGDEIRHVHWKVTARTGTLMVREYTDPAEPRFAVILDNRPDVLSDALFEDAVEVAASLTHAALAAGHRVRLVTTGEGIDIESNAGLAGSLQMLDALCEVDLADEGLVPQVASGAVVFISGGDAAGDARVLAGLRASHSTVTLIDLRPKDRSGQAPAGMRLVSATSAAEAINRWNAVTAR